MCSVFLPFSLLPFIMSYTRLTGAVISLLHRTLVYLDKKKLEKKKKKNNAPRLYKISYI